MFDILLERPNEGIQISPSNQIVNLQVGPILSNRLSCDVNLPHVENSFSFSAFDEDLGSIL
jgi:hypothetical protein